MMLDWIACCGGYGSCYERSLEGSNVDCAELRYCTEDLAFSQRDP
jgi:hypothetical protein